MLEARLMFPTRRTARATVMGAAAKAEAVPAMAEAEIDGPGVLAQEILHPDDAFAWRPNPACG
jgi:hypothetical protein